MTRPPRRLVSTRRRVPPARRAAYDAAWAQVQAEAGAVSAHAWRFASATQPELFLDFLEFASDADPRRLPGLAGALARLEAELPGEAEEWSELRDG